jgi:hypothetical protein
MNNNLNLADIWLWLTTYIFYGGIVPIVGMLLLATYVRGYFVEKKIQREIRANEFSITSKKFSPAYNIFKGVNKIFDACIGFVLAGLKKPSWESVYSLACDIIPDSLIKRVLSACGADTSYKARTEKAMVEFDEKSNAFWWNRKRAPDFRNISPVISGKWFNGKPVEDYIAFLIPTKVTYAALRTSVIVSLAAFLVLSVLYRPQVLLGWQAESIKQDLASELSQQIIADPSIIPEFRKDVWSKEEQDAIQEKANAYAVEQGYALVDNAHGCNFSVLGIFFKNGFATTVFVSLLAGVMFARKSYYSSYKSLRVPYIRDSHEIKGYESKKAAIDSYKLALSAANIRAVGYDRNSPLLSIYKSAGTMEKRGAVGARRYLEKIYQSVLDFAQNLLIIGATGTGKSRSVIIPLANHWFYLKSIFMNNEKAYNKIFDTRINRLTQEAIKEGWLETYRPLPNNPLVVAMMIMDIKCQLWTELIVHAKKYNLENEFVIIGSKKGQVALDPLAGIDSNKVKSILKSLGSQMGSTDGGDFWSDSALQWIQKFGDVNLMFSRTRAGAKFMARRKMKVWSLMFLYELVVLDDSSELLTHAIYSIYEDYEECPERLADLINLERIQSIGALVKEWQDLPAETKGGIKANMTRVMDGYNNSRLRPFLTGVGENMIKIAEVWKHIMAFDLSTDYYGQAGKMIQLFVKTLVYEEAVNRQMRYSSRVVEISDTFLRNYPNLGTLEPSVELLPIAKIANKEVANLHGEFVSTASEVQQSLTMDQSRPVVWEAGTFTNKLRELASLESSDPSFDDYSAPVTQATVELSKRALDIVEQIKVLEPGLVKQLSGIADIDPSMFNALPGDSAEVAEKKREHMHLYYQYKDAKTRISREHLQIIIDEAQALVTIDKDEGCYSDYNFPNVNRSTKTQLAVATQSLGAFEMRIGKEPTNNFAAQMRSQIFLVTEDHATREYVTKIAGTGNIFHSALTGKPLLDGGKETGLELYDNLNYYIAKQIDANRSLVSKGVEIPKDSLYPYTFDVFAEGEPLDIELSVADFKGVFTNMFGSSFEFSIPSFKRHFLDLKGIPEHKMKGSAAQGEDSNEAEILNAWKQAHQSMEDKYNGYLDKGYVPNSPYLSDDEYTSQGNVHAFVTIQRAGMSVKEHVLIAPVDDYIEG